MKEAETEVEEKTETKNPIVAEPEVFMRDYQKKAKPQPRTIKRKLNLNLELSKQS